MTGLFAISFWTFFRLVFSGDFHRFEPVVHGKPPAFDMNIFAQCYDEASIPMQVALGNFYKISYLCSKTYFDRCKQQLPVALANKTGFQPYQIDYIMSTLLNWVDGGGKFLCNMGEYDIREMMVRKGGYACTKDYYPEEIQACSHSLALLRSGYQYSDEYCRTLDSDIQCYMDIVRKCESQDLSRYFQEFFQSVIWTSPCRHYSRFANSAPPTITSLSLVTLVVITWLCLWKLR